MTVMASDVISFVMPRWACVICYTGCPLSTTLYITVIYTGFNTLYGTQNRK